MQTHGFITIAVLGLGAVTTACATTASAQSDPTSRTTPARMTIPTSAPDPAVSAGQENAMMEDCKAMKQQKQTMAADMKAEAAALTEHVARMNAASKEKKTEVMAEVLTHMVNQQNAMDARKAKMEEEMMKHMMQHMQLGKDSMAKCPMMTMADDPATTPGEHHHDGK
jgi:hypothetical protein